MALYTYKCPKCNEEQKVLCSVEDKPSSLPCKCGENAEYQLPSTGNSITYETKDKYQGKQTKKNQETQMKERMHQHINEYELAERIDKYGLNEAERTGILKKVKKV